MTTTKEVAIITGATGGIGKAIQDAKKGKDVSICSFYVKCQHLNVKLMPHKLVMSIWMRGIRKYL